jgi:hypothetical protein
VELADPGKTVPVVLPEPVVDSELTMSEVLAGLSSDGYTASFRLEDGLRCPNGCAGRPTIDAMWRFEGSSDPDDEGIVVALRCSACGTLGTLVAAYGAVLDLAEGEALAGLEATKQGSAGSA